MPTYEYQLISGSIQNSSGTVGPITTGLTLVGSSLYSGAIYKEFDERLLKGSLAPAITEFLRVNAYTTQMSIKLDGVLSAIPPGFMPVDGNVYLYTSFNYYSILTVTELITAEWFFNADSLGNEVNVVSFNPTTNQAVLKSRLFFPTEFTSIFSVCKFSHYISSDTPGSPGSYGGFGEYNLVDKIYVSGNYEIWEFASELTVTPRRNVVPGITPVFIRGQGLNRPLKSIYFDGTNFITDDIVPVSQTDTEVELILDPSIPDDVQVSIVIKDDEEVYIGDVTPPDWPDVMIPSIAGSGIGGIDFGGSSSIVMIADPSGIYTLQSGLTHDVLYERTGIDFQNVKIPDPFFKTGFFK